MIAEREPTADELAGMAWWNALSDDERGRWLRLADSAVPADAWERFKAAGGVWKAPAVRIEPAAGVQ